MLKHTLLITIIFVELSPEDRGQAKESRPLWALTKPELERNEINLMHVMGMTAIAAASCYVCSTWNVCHQVPQGLHKLQWCAMAVSW